MRVLLQRVRKAKVEVNSNVVGSINDGILVLVGFTHNDNSNDIDYIVNKIINLRIFDDENGIMNKSVLDIKGSILSVSQFTLYGNTKKGRRPSYTESLNGEFANKLYDEFNEKLSKYIHTETGIFGTDMQVSLINDGPATFLVESR